MNDKKVYIILEKSSWNEFDFGKIKKASSVKKMPFGLSVNQKGSSM